MNVTTRDSACSFGVRLTGKSACKYVNQIKVYHNFDPGYDFSLCLGDSGKFRRSDYPGKGYTEYQFSNPKDSVCFLLSRLDTNKHDFVLYGFSLENTAAPGFYLAGLGANGASSSSFLRIGGLAQQLSTLHPDLVIFSLGVNDTQTKGFTSDDYIENYDSLIVEVKKANPDCAILLTTTTDNYIKRRTSNKRTISAREAMMQLTRTPNVAVWDLFSLMGGYRSMPKWYKAGLAAKDKVHFNAKGYVVVGTLMYEALMRSYNYSGRIK